MGGDNVVNATMREMVFGPGMMPQSCSSGQGFQLCARFSTSSVTVYRKKGWIGWKDAGVSPRPRNGVRYCGTPRPPQTHPPCQIGPVKNTLVQKLAEAKVDRAGIQPSLRLLLKSRATQMACKVPRWGSQGPPLLCRRARLCQLLGDGAREADTARRREWALAARWAEAF